MTATDRYCKMWTAWQAVTERLATESPIVLSEFLRLASRETGITRSELQRELRLKQPRESKLSTKLIDQKWLEIVPRSNGAAPLEFLRTTPAAQSAMTKLEALLEFLSPTPPVARTVSAGRRGLQIPANANRLFPSGS